MYGEYTEGVWPIHINDLNCTGSEESVWECPHNGIVRYSCNHQDDASVMCQGTSNINCTYVPTFPLLILSCTLRVTSPVAGNQFLNIFLQLSLSYRATAVMEI